MKPTHLTGLALELRWLQPLYHRLADRPELLRALEHEAGLRRTDPSDHSLIDPTALCDLVERLHAAGEPHICAWLALQFDASVGNGQVYFLRSCSQVRELLAELLTKQPLMLPFGLFDFYVDTNLDTGSFTLRLQPHSPPQRLATLLLAEGALAWLQRILDLSLPVGTAPLAACTMAPPSPGAMSLQTLLGAPGAPVQFGAPQAALRYPDRLLDQALPGGNPRVKHAMRAGFVALLRHSDAPRPLSRRLIHCLVANNGAERASIASIASMALQLDMSGKDLRKQLAAKGMHFSDIHNAHRRRLAFQRLILEGAPMEAVVRSLGYASRSSLERAFATWFDSTPAQARHDRLLLAAMAIDDDWNNPVELLRMLPTARLKGTDAGTDAAELEDPQHPASQVLHTYLLGHANRAEYGGKPLSDAASLPGPLGPQRLNQLVRGLHLQAGPGHPVAALAPVWQARRAALERLPGLPWFEALHAGAQRRAQQDLAWYELGTLLMYRMVGAPYGHLLHEAQGQPRALVLEQERQRYGLDRHAAAALLLSAWGLPRDVIHAQRAASQPATAAAMQLAALYEPLYIPLPWPLRSC